jgi:hypothetical protein
MRQDEVVTDDTASADDLIDALPPQEQAHDRDSDGMDDRLEMVLAAVFALVAASVARKATGRIWQAATGRTPPTGDREAGASLGVIMLWGAFAGAATGAAHALAGRQAKTIVRSRHSD